MSGELVGWVLDRATVRGADLLVLLDIAERVRDAESEAFASVQKIAVRTNCSERTVHASLRSLEAEGWIERVGTTGNGTTRWRLIVREVPRKKTRGEIRDETRARQPVPPEQISPPAETSPPERIAPGEVSAQPPAEISQPPAEISPKPLLTVREPSQAHLLVGAAPDEAATTSNGPDSDLPKIDPGPDARRLSQLLADLVLERDPRAKVQPESRRWLDSMRLLLADRHGDVEEVERVLRWSQADEFWRANVLSPPKLREKFPQLKQQSERRSGAGGTRSQSSSPGQRPRPLPTTERCVIAHPKAADAWMKASMAIRDRIGAATFETWFGDAHPHRLERHDAERTLVIAVLPEKLGWIRDRFSELLAGDGWRIQLVGCAGPGGLATEQVSPNGSAIDVDAPSRSLATVGAR